MRKNRKISLKLFIGSLSMASVSVMTVVITANQIGKQKESQKKIMDYSKGKKLQLAAPSVAPIMSTKPIMSAATGNKIVTPPNLVRTNKILQSFTTPFGLIQNLPGKKPKYTGIYLIQVTHDDVFNTVIMGDPGSHHYIKINDAERTKLKKLGIHPKYPVIGKNLHTLFYIPSKTMQDILNSTDEQIVQIDRDHGARLLEKGDKYTAPLNDYNRSGVNSISGANGALVKKMLALQNNIYTLEQWNKMINIYYDLKEIDDRAMAEINKNKTIFEKDKNVKNKEALKLMGEARHMDSKYNKFNYLTYDEMHSLRNKYKYLIRLLRDKFTLNEDQIESYINSEKRLVKWDEEFKKLMRKFGINTKKINGRIWAHLPEAGDHDYKNGFNFKIRNVDNFHQAEDKVLGKNLFLGAFDDEFMLGVKTHKTEILASHYDDKIDSINWSISLTGTTGNPWTHLYLTPTSLVGMNNLIKSLFSNGKNDAVSKVFKEFGTNIKFKNIVKLRVPEGNPEVKHTLFRLGIEKLEMSYKKDANLVGEEIKLARKDLEECKQRLDGLDKRRENVAFNALKNLAVNDLGFIPTSGFGAPDLSFLQINVSNKRQIDRYKSRLKSFNKDQIWLLDQARQESKVRYTNDKANPYGYIEKPELDELDLLRKNIINFDTYSAFLAKFKQLKDYSDLRELIRLKKAVVVKKIDLGFITKEKPPSEELGENYTTDEFMAYNRQMSNFNSAQSNQLSIARSLSNSKYSNEQINVHGYLEKIDAIILNKRRDNIQNNQTNNEFLSYVKTVRRKGITLWLDKIKVKIDSNSFLNKFGFLQDSDINSTSNFYIALHKYENAINAPNADVMEERYLEKKLEHEVYKLQQKDSITQINQIEALKSKPFNDLGFTPSQETINKKVKMPAIGYSTKTQIDAYANYVQVFNAEQEKLLLEAKEEAKTTYKNSNANVYGNLSSTGVEMRKLDTAREGIINKDTYNAFVNLFEVVKGIDKDRNDFTRKNLTKPVDLFFIPTKGFEKPDDLPAIPSIKQYKAYNKAMIDFNSDQFKQLIQAQTLAKTRYTDEVANERHNLTKKELKDLQDKRNNIKNAHDDIAFRNLFNTLRAKDLLISIDAIDKGEVNKFGYLTSGDFATLEGNIDALKDKIKKFITLKGKTQVYNQDMIAKIIKDSTYNADFLQLMEKFDMNIFEDGWARPYSKDSSSYAKKSHSAINFQINDHNESFFVGQDPKSTEEYWGSADTGVPNTMIGEMTVSKIKDFTDWKIKVTNSSDGYIFLHHGYKASIPFVPVNNLLKKILGKYTNNDDVERIDVTFKNISNILKGKEHDRSTWRTRFKIMIKEIKITYRKDLSYYKSFDQDMLEVVKDLKEKDENAQAAAIKSLKIIKDLGFEPSDSVKVLETAKPKLGITVKNDIEAYNEYVIDFNADQDAQYKTAKDSTTTTYANDNANIHKTLSEITLRALDVARNAVKDKTSFEVFVNLFKVDKDNDQATFEANNKNMVKPKSLGFYPTTDEFKQPGTLLSATPEEFREYNKQMNKFNQDQAAQLTTAQSLARIKYADDQVNEYNNLTSTDLTKLGTKRNTIKNSKTNDAFLALFNKLRAKDLLTEANKIKHNDINKFGYLEGSDFKQLDANIKTLHRMLRKYSNNTYWKRKVKEFDEAKIKKLIKYNITKHNSNYDTDFLSLMKNKFETGAYKDPDGTAWAMPYSNKKGGTANSGKYGANFSINGNNESLFVGQDPGAKWWSPGSRKKTTNQEVTVSKTSDFANWKIKMTGACQDWLWNAKGNTEYAFEQVNNFIKNLNAYKNNLIKSIDITFKNNSKFISGPNGKVAVFKIDISKIKIVYKDLSDYKTFDKDIFNVVKDLKNQDANAQKDAIEALKQIVDLGFTTTIIKVAKPIIGISTKSEVEDYAQYVLAFNDEQTDLLAEAKTDAKTKYDELKVKETLTDIMKANLEDVRKAVVDRKTYDVFLKLYESDKKHADTSITKLKEKAQNEFANAKLNKLGYLVRGDFISAKINDLRNAIKDIDTYNKFIIVKDGLLALDKIKQKKAIHAIKVLFDDKGFKSTIKSVPEPKLGISTKTEIDAYVDYVKAFNANQAAQLKTAKDSTTTAYTNDKANVHKTLSQVVLKALDDARIAVKDKATFDAFVNLFKVDKDDDKATFEANNKNLVETKDLGFDPTTKEFKQPDSLGKNAIPEEYKKYNKQMSKFNQDQAAQLKTAQDLAKDQYTNAKANENGNLDKVADLGPLDVARIAIADKDSNDAFLNLFRVLKAKDFSDKIINHFGYLSTSDMTDIDSLRKAVKDNPGETSYKAFIAKKDALILKDKNAQINAIDSLTSTPLSTLGFKSTIKSVPEPKLGISTKTEIDAYVDYIKAFNANQAAQLKAAKDSTTTTYTNDKANVHKTLSQFVLKALDDARIAVKDKATFDAFVNLFKVDKADDKATFEANNKNLVETKDLGFDPTTKEFKQPDSLGKNAIPEEYKKYNKQMSKFNQDQAAQLKTAQDLAKDQYTNAKANENGNLDKVADLGPLDVARIAIADKDSNDVFLNLFRVLKAKDFSDKIINHFGYLSTSDMTDIDSLRKAVKDKPGETSYKAFIAKKDALILKDKNAQINAIDSLTSTPLSTLGFKSTIKSVPEPKLGISTKTEIDAYVDYVKAFNANQAAQLKAAKDSTTTTYTNDKANVHKTLSQFVLKALDDARIVVKDKTTFDAFVNLFKVDKADDQATYDANNNSLVETKDLGFDPTTEEFKQPDSLGKNAIPEEYKKYNKQMSKFNQDQAAQLKTAQDLAKDQYTNAKANENGNLDKVADLGPLDVARIAIADKDSNDAFLNLFRVLKAKDFSNKIINHFGYLSTSDMTDIDSLRKAVKDKPGETSYKAFIAKKDALILKDKNAQINAIDSLTSTPLSTLGFKSTIKSVPEPKLGISTKTEIDAYVDYVKAFNANQAAQLKAAKDSTTTTYTNDKANVHKTLSQFVLKALDDARIVVKDKTTFDAFVNLFKVDKADDQATYDANNNSLVETKDLGFDPTTEEFKQPDSLGKNAIPEEYKKYNKQMSKFNQDQAAQLKTAQDLAKDQYTNAKANENGNLDKVADLGPLDVARIAIADKDSNDAFLNLFRVLKAKDFSNKIINHFGYLSTSDMTDIDSLRKAVKDNPGETSYKTFIAKKDALILKDKNAQINAIDSLTSTPLSALGFKSTIKSVPEPKLGISTKTEIDAYVDYVKAFNANQAAQLKAAKDSTTTTYTNDKANVHKTLSQVVLKALDDARIAVKDKATFDAFVNLFKVDKADDKATFEANNKNLVETKDLGFDPTTKEFKQPDSLGKNAIPEEYKKYNKQMSKFNQDQAAQLKTAQDLAKDQYTNAKANENGNLDRVADLGPLDVARIAIADKDSNDAFLNLFRVLKAKDFSNKIINHFGYLSTSDMTDIDSLRKAVKDNPGETSYKAFIAKKDALILKDKNAQINAIDSLTSTPLSTLGFKSTIKSVPEPKLGISTKTEIDAYVDYVKAFNANQAAQLKAAKDSTTTTYTNDKANVHKTLSQFVLKALDDARIAVKDKTTFDAFVNLFKVDKADDQATYDANNNSLVETKDLGFDPTTKEFKQPDSLGKNAIPEEYKKYNKQMSKFNQDQAAQLKTAQDLAKDQYTNAKANENGNLDKVADLGPLDVARIAIADKDSNDTFLNLFRVLKAKDFSNKIINHFGYLSTSDMTDIDSLRKAVKDKPGETSYKAFIAKKDALILKDKNAQINAIDSLTSTPLSTLGFKSTIKSVPEPKLGISTKTEIDAYVDYVKAFNANQTAQLKAAKDSTTTTYTNDKANVHKTLSQVVLKALDDARIAVKDKATFDAFVNLFKVDKDDDKATFEANNKNLVETKDLGFDPTTEEFKQPDSLGKNAIPEEYKKYNKQMSKFNQDQAAQLKTAQDLAKDQYTNAKANENGNLDKVADLGPLDVARIAIADKDSNDAFLNLFRVLKAKDFSNKIINHFGYLSTSDMTDIDSLRKAVKDKPGETSYKAFIAKKDALILKDKNAQINAIDSLTSTPLSTLGFKSTIKSVPEPKLGISTKTEIDAYVDYVKAFNANQTAQLKAAKDSTTTTYTNDKANVHKTLSQVVLKALDDARIAVKDKATFDAFVNLFKVDKDDDKATFEANNKNLVETKDLGFDPTTKEFKQPDSLGKNAIPEEYKKYNKQMSKFNQDQAAQLKTAQDLAKDQYTNAKANENGNLDKVADLGPLDVARIAIADKDSNDTFLNLFRVLKAKDFSDKIINRFGYLSTSDVTDIDSLRKAVKDNPGETSYKAFIAKKDALILKDKNAQINAIDSLTSTPLSTLGFKSTIKSVPEPKLGISTKTEIDAYVDYVKAFNANQTAQLKAAKDSTTTTYTNDKANVHKTLSQFVLKALDDARIVVKDKATFDAFVNLFKVDKADDQATYDANNNSLVEVKDLGFDPTTEEFKQPDSLGKNAIPEEYKKYNKQMSKFNQDQAAQLKTAQDLAKDQYTNAKANENGNLDKVADLGPLDVARIAIADKDSNDTFLNLFRVLKAKDFSNKIINHFGYLSTSDMTDIDSLRKAVKDNPGETSYKAFIAKKDALILKDKNAQINAIDSLTSTPLSTLGFKSTIKSVPEPKLGISTKTEIDAYVDYVKAFNANQTAQLKAAKDSTTTTYTNDKANVHKTLSQFVLKALDDARIVVKDKATFDAFVNLFKVDKADDQATYDANNNSLVEVKDLGFDPTTEEFKQPDSLKENAIPEEYKKYNKQVSKFNQDQAAQLKTAQDLAKDQYTNAKANENGNLDKVADLGPLDVARIAIADKDSNDTFLNLFRVLKAKDFSNKIINHFGYLSTSDMTDIDSLRKAVKDNPGETSYKAFIAKKDALILKDKNAQINAIDSLTSTPLSTLGFKSTIKSVPEPKLGISTKTEIDAYVDYVKAFNANQAAQLKTAKDSTTTTYTNDKANVHKTLSQFVLKALDDARIAVKDKATFDAFVNLFKVDKADDQATYDANNNSLVEVKDLGFDPTTEEFKQPDSLGKNAIPEEYKKYNKQMSKFNQDQAAQLKTAQDLAKDQYTNAKANENGNLDKVADLGPLDVARIAIADKDSNDAFLNLFRVLKAKDFSNKIINHFGYLSTSDMTDIDSLRKAVKDNPGETSYKAFIAKRDALILKDKNAQINAIDSLTSTPLSTLGFKSTIKSVPEPKLGISTKTEIDAYVDYVKAFNANQAAQLKTAKDSTTTTYTNDKANVHKTLSQFVLKALDDARIVVKDKATFDAFVNLFKVDKADDQATYDANNNSLVEVKDLGFDPTTEEFKQPDSLGKNAIPEEYKKYNKQVSKFNQDQAAQLKTAQDLAKDQYTNAKANENGNLDKVADLGPLDVARIAIADKDSNDTFLNLFRVLKAKDFSNKIINHFGYLSTSDMTDIDSLRKAVKDNPGETSYKAFIAKKDALILKDKNAQINAIDSLTSTPLSTLGFKSTIKSVPEPKLGISTKTEIDAYVDYVKAFNANQAAQLKTAKDSTTTTYTNDKANVHKTLSQFVLKALDDARIAVKDKATFDAFVNLFKVDKADDQATYDANNNSLVEVKDLGFDPTTEEFKQPDSLGKNAIPEEYKKYNKQVSKFNQDQAAQLKTAQDLAKDQYTNAKANENGNLDKVADLGPLDVARIAIADKDSNDTFLNLFRVLKAKDFSNKIINRFGYLSKDSDLKGINALRADVKDKDTYDKFIAQKDVLIKKDQDAQAKAIKGLTALNILGFESSESVKKLKTDVPKKGVSTKADIDTYVAYASAFNQEQNDSLKNAIEEAKTTYTNDKANIHKTLSETILTNLDTVRTAIKDKTTFEVFKKLFIFDQESDAKNFEDVQNRIVKANDLGFVSPVGFEKPETVKGDATAEKYKVYNLQMNKFNQDQDNQLSTAITLSTSKYADENVNEYKHLDKELKDLDDLRKAIKNKASNDDFVAMFKKLRGQDLKVEVTINFSDAKINALGYLKSKDINNKVKGNDDFAKIDTLREEVKDESTYKIFIKERDRLVALDKQRQEAAISSLGELKDLGFPSRKPKVASPIINISKKEDVDKYVQYIIDFNKEQKDLLKIAKTLATTKYAINKLDENQHRASTDAKTKLVSVRRKIVNKKTFDIFVAKFQALRLVNLKATVLDFGKKEINALGYLGDKDFHDSNIKQLGNDVKDESTYKIFIKEKDRLVTLDRKRQIAAIKSLIKSSKKLGFTSTIKLVDPIEKGISTKKQVEAYAKYMKAYSAEQTKKLRKVQNDAATIYTNEKVNEHGHLEAKNLTNLDNLRTQIKTKDSYDRFIDKFNELKLLDDRLEVSNKFTDEIINKNKKLTKGELEILDQVRKNIGQKGGYQLLKNVSEMLKRIGKEREKSGTIGKDQILKVIDPDGEGAPNPDELGENPTLMQIIKYNNRVATYNERQRLIKQQAIKEMKNRVAQLKANSQPVIPFSQEENILLDDKEKKINLLVNLATITKAVDDYEHEYNQLLDKKLKKLKGLVKDAKKVNKIINFGFIDKDAPKLPTLSSEGNLTKEKLDDYKTAVSKFNYYQQTKKIEAQKKLKTFVVDEEHVNKEKIDELNKAKKEIEDASNSDRYAQLYNNFVEQYANSAGGILADSKTKNLLKIAIPSVSGLLIVFLVGIIFKQKRNKKNWNNFGGKTSTGGDGEIEDWGDGEIEDWGDGEVEEWGDDGLDGWE